VIHVDTAFLIDLYRETKGERPGDAFDLIDSLDDREVLGVSVYALCEIRVGAELHRNPLREHELLDELISGLFVSYPDDRFAPAYARLLAFLTRGKRLIGTMDLLIATAAVLDDATLITRNVKDFSRVPGLRVLGY
jgi:tRNA(fMet)-specific endonuclease VapC